MANMKIERCPGRIVKPDRPSSGELVPLSSSDLVVPRIHVEVLYAFKAPAPETQVLEKGLSKTLSYFPEFAGRLSTPDGGRPSFVLNDAGAVLIEAQADGALDDLWPFKPSRRLLDLIPVNRGVPELFLVQLTRFTCGGMTVGIARHHQVADGEAASEFMNSWGFTVRGLPIPVSPIHDRCALMPRDPPQPIFDLIEYKKAPQKPNGTANDDYPDLAISKLQFSAELLRKIKSEAVKGAADGVNYSTFVSLLAHLWRCITKARGLENEEGETRALVAVNMRKRMSPPLPRGYFGNAIFHTCPQTSLKQLMDEPLSFSASLINDSINSVTDDYMRSALDFIEIQQRSPVQIALNLCVSSWVTLPLYELDFGMGTPVFAGIPFIPFEGLVILAPSPERDGSIDVVLGLFAPDMEKLEAICFDLNS